MFVGLTHDRLAMQWLQKLKVQEVDILQQSVAIFSVYISLLCLAADAGYINTVT